MAKKNSVKKTEPQVSIIEVEGRRCDKTSFATIGDLDDVLDDAAEGGGWSPSFNRLLHVLLTAWISARQARPSVREITLRFPSESAK